jgi:hypothetical protein
VFLFRILEDHKPKRFKSEDNEVLDSTYVHPCAIGYEAGIDQSLGASNIAIGYSQLSNNDRPSMEEINAFIEMNP